MASQSKSRIISAEKEALIEKGLQERLSQCAIARTLSAGLETVRRVLKKVGAKPREFFRHAWRNRVAGLVQKTVCV